MFDFLPFQLPLDVTPKKSERKKLPQEIQWGPHAYRNSMVRGARWSHTRPVLISRGLLPCGPCACVPVHVSQPAGPLGSTGEHLHLASALPFLVGGWGSTLDLPTTPAAMGRPAREMKSYFRQGFAIFVYEGPNSKYFRLCGPHRQSDCSICLHSTKAAFNNVKPMSTAVRQ